MKMNLGQRQSLSQSLVLTPQMQQSIKLLQMPLVELRETIEQELLDNPTLEATQEEASQEQNTNEPVKESTESLDFEKENSFEELMNMDEDWQSYYNSTQTPMTNRQEEQEKQDYWQNSIHKHSNLCDYLQDQIQLFDYSPEEQLVAEQILGNISDSGYLEASIEEISEQTDQKEALIQKVLEDIRGLEPAGLACFSLVECLLAQLDTMPESPCVLMAIEILGKHLALFERNRFSELTQALDCDKQQLQQAIDLIRSLEPEPGKQFQSIDPQYITPDMSIKKIQNEWLIFSNDEHLPTLRISKRYKKMFQDQSTEKDTKEYIKDKMQSAVWLIKAIQQRKNTLYRITEVILETQINFLEHGLSRLKPLNLKDVAERLELHESTISRATTNKYVETPQGTFAFKYFFGTSLKSSSGQETSNKNIQAQIAALVKSEDPFKPLSDQAIVDAFKQKGIDIARRTVTKYRKILGIPSSSMRKKYH